jgi:hypothetical protein
MPKEKVGLIRHFDSYVSLDFEMSFHHLMFVKTTSILINIKKIVCKNEHERFEMNMLYSFVDLISIMRKFEELIYVRFCIIFCIVLIG